MHNARPPDHVAELPRDLKAALNLFLAAPDPHSLQSRDWLHFYDFIALAYQVSATQRPAVSELADALRAAGFTNPGGIVVTYAHCLYVLARHEQRTIYENGFNP